MEIFISVIAYAVLVALAVIGFKKLYLKVSSLRLALESVLLLQRNASRREQAIKYDLARQKSKLEKVLKKVSRK